MGLWNKGVRRSKYNMLRREDLIPDLNITPDLLEITDEDYSHFYIKKFENAIEVIDQRCETLCFYMLDEKYSRNREYRSLDIFDITSLMISSEKGKKYENMLSSDEFKHAAVMTYNSVKHYKKY